MSVSGVGQLWHTLSPLLVVQMESANAYRAALRFVDYYGVGWFDLEFLPAYAPVLNRGQSRLELRHA